MVGHNVRGCASELYCSFGVQRSSDIGFSLCTVPTYYCGVQVFHTESGSWSLEVVQRLNIALIEVSIGLD